MKFMEQVRHQRDLVEKLGYAHLAESIQSQGFKKHSVGLAKHLQQDLTLRHLQARWSGKTRLKTKQPNHGDAMYNMGTVVNNIVL